MGNHPTQEVGGESKDCTLALELKGSSTSSSSSILPPAAHHTQPSSSSSCSLSAHGWVKWPADRGFPGQVMLLKPQSLHAFLLFCCVQFYLFLYIFLNTHLSISLCIFPRIRNMLANKFRLHLSSICYEQMEKPLTEELDDQNSCMRPYFKGNIHLFL